MTYSVSTALFVYSPDGAPYLQQLRDFRVEATIHGIVIADLLKDPGKYLETISRVIVAADLSDLKTVIKLAEKYDFSIGIVPLPSQKNQTSLGGIPTRIEESFEIALSNRMQEIRCVFYNEHIVLFQAASGEISFLATPDDSSLQKILEDALAMLKMERLTPVKISKAGEPVEIDTETLIFKGATTRIRICTNHTQENELPAAGK